MSISRTCIYFSREITHWLITPKQLLPHISLVLIIISSCQLDLKAKLLEGRLLSLEKQQHILQAAYPDTRRAVNLRWRKFPRAKFEAGLPTHFPFHSRTKKLETSLMPEQTASLIRGLRIRGSASDVIKCGACFDEAGGCRNGWVKERVARRRRHTLRRVAKVELEKIKLFRNCSSSFKLSWGLWI